MTTSFTPMGSMKESTDVNSNGQMYGTSKYMQPTDRVRLLAEAEFEDFAPCPCICCLPLVPDKARKRTYARIYENRLEMNFPKFPCLCCSKERCIRDDSFNYFFDQQPSRVGMCCWCFPCICCGPPVLFTHIPRACCGLVDLRPCFGETIKASPCNCFNLRCCLCIGTPCYHVCSQPLIPAVKNGEVFLGKWKGALEAYAKGKPIPPDQYALFKRLADRACDCDANTDIASIPVEVMDRGAPAEPTAIAVPIGAVTGLAKPEQPNEEPTKPKSKKKKKKKKKTEDITTEPGTVAKKKKKKPKEKDEEPEIVA